MLAFFFGSTVFATPPWQSEVTQHGFGLFTNSKAGASNMRVGIYCEMFGDKPCEFFVVHVGVNCLEDRNLIALKSSGSVEHIYSMHCKSLQTNDGAVAYYFHADARVIGRDLKIQSGDLNVSFKHGKARKTATFNFSGYEGVSKTVDQIANNYRAELRQQQRLAQQNQQRQNAQLALQILGAMHGNSPPPSRTIQNSVFNLGALNHQLRGGKVIRCNTQGSNTTCY